MPIAMQYFGGTYRLALRFEGGELSAAEDKPETAQEDAPVQTYAPLNGDGWLENASVFTVTPREITITPKTMKAETLFAGDTAENLLTEGMDVQNLVEKDKKFFEYAEIAAGNFDTCFGGKMRTAPTVRVSAINTISTKMEAILHLMEKQTILFRQMEGI